ncbi:hypothetical protein D3C72_1788490 [compost metagenome]
MVAICSDSGTTSGLEMPDSSTNTNLTTTQVSQIGNRVSRPVRNRRCREGRGTRAGASSDMRAL